MTQTIARNVSILNTKYGMAEDTARNLTGFSINGVFVLLNTEYHENIQMIKYDTRLYPPPNIPSSTTWAGGTSGSMLTS